MFIHRCKGHGGRNGGANVYLPFSHIADLC